MSTWSAALSDYAAAFADPHEPFLSYFHILPDKSVRRQEFARGEFWSLAKRAARVLRERGVGQGCSCAHYFSGNRPEDLAFRLGATMVGAVPVTINWQADTLERVMFKVEITRSAAVITDSGVPAEHSDALAARFPGLSVFPVEELEAQPELPEAEFCRSADLDLNATRIIIFTSGTTAQPKGVRLPYRCYATNAATFESFLELRAGDAFSPVIVNPLHHTNSTAFTDWAMRRPGTRLHLIERYSTAYWAILAEVAGRAEGRVVAPLVSRHFDYLENLRGEGKLPVPLPDLRAAMRKVDFLLGSAPVGPATVGRVEEYAGRPPLVRFGSTETCLQVTGTPLHLSDERKREAFQRGWAHAWKGEAQCGYWIGRPHPPHTDVRVVRSVDPLETGYLGDCGEGEPGYLITRGDNVMSGYVGNDEATRRVLREGGWYTGLGDVCFWLTDPCDGERDYYWVSREAAMLTRGGAKYSCAQVEAELKEFLVERYGLARDGFDLAVVGLRVESEHEDTCCVTIELTSEAAQAKRAEIERTFLSEARGRVTKGARPDRLRFAGIPRNFKGAVQLPELKAQCLADVQSRADIASSQ